MTLALSAVARSEKANALRKQGFMPAVLYGQGKTAEHVAIDARVFTKIYKQAGESTLVDLAVGDAAPRKVVIHDVQVHPLSGEYVHADFYTVDMQVTMRVAIPLEFTGMSSAVKEQGGILVKSVSSVHVECLPKDLVHAIQIDLGILSTLGQSIRLRDVVLPPGLKLLDNPEETAVSVAVPRSEAQLEADLATAAVPGVETVEVEKKGKTDEEGEEGAAAGDAAPKDAAEKKQDKKAEK